MNGTHDPSISYELPLSSSNHQLNRKIPTDLVSQAPDPPVFCRHVDRVDNVSVEMRALRQCAIERHLADLSTHRGLR